MKISFVLIGEGASDLRMVSHIENILVEEGFDEVSGKPLAQEYGDFPIGRTTGEKLVAAIRQFPGADLIIVHRDADGAGLQAREHEIARAVETLHPEFSKRVIPMIPVRMLEAWLLASSTSINRIAGNRDEMAPVACLPALRNIESKAAPKDILLDALCEASGATGGRLVAFKKRFFEMRARLTEDLDVNGPQNQLPSYRRFRERVHLFAGSLLEE